MSLRGLESEKLVLAEIGVREVELDLLLHGHLRRSEFPLGGMLHGSFWSVGRRGGLGGRGRLGGLGRRGGLGGAAGSAVTAPPSSPLSFFAAGASADMFLGRFPCRTPKYQIGAATHSCAGRLLRRALPRWKRAPYRTETETLSHHVHPLRTRPRYGPTRPVPLALGPGGGDRQGALMYAKCRLLYSFLVRPV